MDKDTTKNGYKYFAFVSYKREDSRWGRWLQKKLQNYRLPSRVCKKHMDIPKRLSPIFLDTTDLPPGDLSENLKKKIGECKYFISVCSKHSKENPKYVDQELVYFLETHDSSMVIPFIIDDAARPEEECFSPQMAELCAKNEIIGVNIHEAGKKRAFLKTVAAMHGIDVVEIENSENRRVRRNRIIASCAAALLLVAGIFAYDFFVPKTHYFLDYTTVYGVPEGICALSKNDIKNINYHYTILSSQGKVRELRYENAYMKLISHENAEYNDRPSKAVYQYGENGVLQTVTQYDNYNNVTVVMAYADSTLKAADLFELDEKGDLVSTTQSVDISDLNIMNIFSKLILPNERTPISRWIYEYDENGYVREIRYALDTRNAAITDAKTVAGVRYERDSIGRTTKTEYLFYKGYGEPDAADASIFQVGTTNLDVRGKRYTYDTDNNLSQITLINMHESPTLSPALWAITENTYTNHNLIKSEYLDKNYEPVLHLEGYSSAQYSYNGENHSVNISYYDTKGDATACFNGYARCTMYFNEHNEAVEISVFDKDGNPTIYEGQGFSGIKSTYNKNGELTSLSFYGTNGEPVIGTLYGYARSETKYDEDGNITERAYYGKDGKLMLNSSMGFARSTSVYDGRKETHSFYGEDGNLIINKRLGCAILHDEYGKNGKVLYEAYFGTDGSPMLHETEKIAGFRAKYNAENTLMYIAYYNTDGSLMVSESDGFAVWELEYNQYGECIKESYFDEKEKPMINKKEGYASRAYDYDENGNIVYDAFLDKKGKPIYVAEHGYAFAKKSFNSRNLVTLVEFYGADGSIITNEIYGYARGVAEYDSNGNRTRLVTYDAQGNIIRQE